MRSSLPCFAPRVLTYVLSLTIVLLGTLGVGAITGSAAISTFGGYVGVITGGLAIYLAFAFLINEMFAREVLPAGKPIRQNVLQNQ
jgi:hypothetical protein